MCMHTYMIILWLNYLKLSYFLGVTIFIKSDSFLQDGFPLSVKQTSFEILYLILAAPILCRSHRSKWLLGKVAKKKTGKSLVFCQTGGGRVSDGSKMPNFYFGKVFFQLACRIILGPPKHVLHLVWSCLNIYLAIKTTLKVSLNSLNWPFYVGYSGQLWPKITKEIYLFLKWDQA